MASQAQFDCLNRAIQRRLNSFGCGFWRMTPMASINPLSFATFLSPSRGSRSPDYIFVVLIRISADRIRGAHAPSAHFLRLAFFADRVSVSFRFLIFGSRPNWISRALAARCTRRMSSVSASACGTCGQRENSSTSSTRMRECSARGKIFGRIMSTCNGSN